MMIYNLIAGGIVTLGIGMVLGFLLLAAVQSRSQPQCLIGKATLEPAGIAIVFGEAIVCGDEVIISDIYGPTVEAWSGEIKFNHNHD